MTRAETAKVALEVWAARKACQANQFFFNLPGWAGKKKVNVEPCSVYKL